MSFAEYSNQDGKVVLDFLDDEAFISFRVNWPCRLCENNYSIARVIHRTLRVDCDFCGMPLGEMIGRTVPEQRES